MVIEAIDAPNVQPKRRKPRLLFTAAHSTIEHLGLIHLLGVARDEGCERKVVLVKDYDFGRFHYEVEDYKPDIVLGSAYSGNDRQMGTAFNKVHVDHPLILRVSGGPHGSYFPEDNLRFSDIVVMSEGFGNLRKIIRGEVKPGILDFVAARDSEPFPHPDRFTFYRDSPEHAASLIKSLIRETGCPFACTYCYNSSTKDMIPVDTSKLSLPVLEACGDEDHSERLFPRNIRTTEAVIREGAEIAENWPHTKMIYFQDDVFGFRLKKFKRDGTYVEGSLEELAELWPSRVGIPTGAQMRWEMTVQDGEERLDLARKSGVEHLTLAIEAENAVVRKETLDRNMPEEHMFIGAKRIAERDFTLRTEQISALPTGTTSVETPMNLMADLGLVDLNSRLSEYAQMVIMGWFATHAPYRRTKIVEDTSIPHGFIPPGFYDLDSNSVKDSFFKRSVQRFLGGWVGPEIGELKNEIDKARKYKTPIPTGIIEKYQDLCEQLRNSTTAWLPDSEQELYRDRNAEFRNHGTYFVLMPEGRRFGEAYLTSDEPYSYERLGRETLTHLRSLADRGNGKAQAILDRMPQISHALSSINGSFTGSQAESIRTELEPLVPYFSVLPQGELAIVRAARYILHKSGEEKSNNLSDAVRHHFYDNIMYRTGENPTYSGNIPAAGADPPSRERYPPKI